MQKPLKHIGAFILLLLFVSIKAAPLHSINHQDGEQESCMICTHVLESSETFWLAPEAFETEQICHPSPKDPAADYTQGNSLSQTYHFVLFSRPPPVA